MTFKRAIRSGFKNYFFGYSSRAGRSEYWYWFLFVVLVVLGTSVLELVLLPFERHSFLGQIALLILLPPSIGTAVRRIHDLGRAGGWLLVALTGIGAFVLLILFCFRGTEGTNEFGSDPLAA